MNILFICSRNQWRSRTAETIFKNNGQHQVRSAGTASSARIKTTQQLINWADLIFVMEQKHKSILYRRFDLTHAAIEILEIPDEYKYMDEELISILRSSVESIFQ